jgi:TonB family protein
LTFNNSHKALAITLLITASVVLSLFNYSIVKQNEEIAEILIDITPPDLLEAAALKELQDIENSQKTNKGFNDTKKYKHFAQAYKPIAPPKDYDDPRLKNRSEDKSEIKKASDYEADANVNKDELTSFKSVNSILSKRKKASKQSSAEASANKNSSIIYSLKDRTDTYLPIPVYLCDVNGKIVVNITVNSAGKVTDTAINTSASTSNNKCLENHALEYAKTTRFDASNKSTQLGTITFSFEGKR